MHNNINKRYLYLATGTAALLFMGLIYAWSIFKKPLSDIFPSLGSFELSMTFTLSIIFFCLGGFFSGRLAERVCYRKRLILAAVVIFIGYFGLSRLAQGGGEYIALKLYILYGVCCGFGFGIGYNAVISVIVPWFPDRTGFASGVLLMGFGIGGMIIGSFVSYAISTVGVMSSFLALSIIVPIAVTLAILIIRETDADDRAALSALLSKGENKTPQAVEKGPSEMLGSAFFWSYALWNILLTSSGLLVVNSAAQIVMLYGAPAVLGLIVSVFNGAGRIIVGALFDRTGGPKASLINGCCLLIAGGLLYMGSMTESIVLIVLGLCFCGNSFGGIPSITSAWIKQAFGAQSYPVNFSLANFTLIPSAILGPLVSSRLYSSSGGSYNSTFIMIIIFASLAIVISVMLAKLERRI